MGEQIPGRLFAVATGFCTVTPDICGVPSLGPASCHPSGVHNFVVITRSLFCTLVTPGRRRNYPQFSVYWALFFRTVFHKK